MGNSALRYLYSDDVMHRIPLIIYNLPGCCGQTHVNKMASNNGQGEINLVIPCGLKENFLGTIPMVHTDHSTFELICGASNMILNLPSTAIAHLHSHISSRRFCTCPLPLQPDDNVLPPPPPPSPVSTIPETPEGECSSDTPDSALEHFRASLSHQRLSLISSGSTFPLGQRPALSSSPSATTQVRELKQQLRLVTQHLVGIALATVRLPILEPDKSLRDTLDLLSVASEATPSVDELDYRNMLAAHFPHSLSGVLGMPAPTIAKSLLPLLSNGWLMQINRILKPQNQSKS